MPGEIGHTPLRRAPRRLGPRRDRARRRLRPRPRPLRLPRRRLRPRPARRRWCTPCTAPSTPPPTASTSSSATPSATSASATSSAPSARRHATGRAPVYNALAVDGWPYREQQGRLPARLRPRLRGQGLPPRHRDRAAHRPPAHHGRRRPGVVPRLLRAAIAPQVDGEQIVFLGEVSDAQKRELFAGARAFVFPILWPEPFGIVMIEAMASGTPVVALRNGSVPEVVRRRRAPASSATTSTRWSPRSSRLDEIDPAACRPRVAERFSVDRMAADYEAIYRRRARGGERRPGAATPATRRGLRPDGGGPPDGSTSRAADPQPFFLCGDAARHAAPSSPTPACDCCPHEPALLRPPPLRRTAASAPRAAGRTTWPPSPRSPPSSAACSSPLARCGSTSATPIAASGSSASPGASPFTSPTSRAGPCATASCGTRSKAAPIRAATGCATSTSCCSTSSGSPRGYYYDADAVRRAPRAARVEDGAVVSATGVRGVRYRRQIELSTALSDGEKAAALAALDDHARRRSPPAGSPTSA